MIDKLKGLLVVDKFFERTPDGPLLVGSKCKECGKVYFPRKKVCYKCFKNDTLEVHPMAKRGQIVTYSISQSLPTFLYSSFWSRTLIIVSNHSALGNCGIFVPP